MDSKALGQENTVLCRNGLIELDIKTKQPTRQNTGVTGMQYQSVCNSELLLADRNNNLVAVNMENMDVSWYAPQLEGVKFVSMTSSSIYAATSDRKLHCIDPKIPSNWMFRTPIPLKGARTQFTSDGENLFYSAENTLVSVAVNNRRVNWHVTPGDRISSPSAISAAFVFVGSDSGKLFCLDKVKGTTVWQTQCCASIRAAPLL